MNKYEILYIVDASISDEEKEKTVAAVSSLIESVGGKCEEADKWGVKKYAYPINYKSEGYYVLTTFEAEKTLVVEIKRIIGITDGIIRRLITKI